MQAEQKVGESGGLRAGQLVVPVGPIQLLFAQPFFHLHLRSFLVRAAAAARALPGPSKALKSIHTKIITRNALAASKDLSAFAILASGAHSVVLTDCGPAALLAIGALTTVLAD